MPVDTTRVISTRRTQKQISEEELKDIELKRLRGELSCAECRRLKLRCDKKVPCGSCLRRGCESICPCGILSAGQGTRFILADTDQLHRKIAEMSNRIRQLEDALAIVQSMVSDERHPLLSDEHLKVKFGSEALDPKKPEPMEEDDPKNVIDALGTLTMGESGEMKYFGRSAGSETLMMAEDSTAEVEEGQGEVPIPLSPEIEHLESMVPLLSHREPTHQLLQHFDSFLPSREKATALSEVYLQHGTFFFRPVKRDVLYESLLPSVYKAALERSEGGVTPLEDSAPHATATLFFIFSLGALLDVNLAPYNGMAEHYYHLGKAALSLRPVCGSPSLETVQAVGLMATYHNLAGKKYSRDSAWCIMSLAAKLAQSFGLHRDSARWNLDAKTVQERRNLFWEVFAADVSHSLALGRPPAIHLSYVDCEFPDDDEATTNQAGEKQSGFWALKHHYAKHIFYAVADATLTAQAPSYETVLELDRKVREMSYQSASKPYASKENDGKEVYHSSSLSLRDFYVSQYRTVTMIYLHRSFFAQAVLDHPTNPLLSSFAPSFLTAYRCASVIIKASVHQFDRCASMAKRIWFLLYHTFSAAVIAGTIVTRSPNSSMARNALKDLNVAIGLFEQAADQSHRARVALTVLKRLQERAHRSFKAIEEGSSPTSEPEATQVKEEEDDELAIFGGQLRVVTKKNRPRGDSTGSPSSPKDGRRTKPRSDSASRAEQESSETSPKPSTSQRARQNSVPNFFGETASGTSERRPPPEQFSSPGNPGSSFIAPNPFSGTSPLSSQPPTFDFAKSLMSAHSVGPRAPDPLSSAPPDFTTDWTTRWPFGHSDSVSPPGPSSNEWLTEMSSISRLLPPPFPGHSHSHPLFPTHNSVQGSESSIGQYPQASQYDLQENAGLLASMLQQNQMHSNPPSNLHWNQGSGSFYPTGASSSSGAPGHPLRGPIVNPGAVELGLSGESRHDSGWIAFMRDCGILGMDTS